MGAGSIHTWDELAVAVVHHSACQWSLATCLANAAVWTKRDYSERNGARTDRLATKDFVMFCVLVPFCEHLS